MEIVEVVEAEEEELAETPAVAQAEAAAKLVEEGLVDLGRATAEDLQGTAMLEARAVDRAGELEGAATVEVVAENSSSLRMRDDEKALDLYYLSTLLPPPPPPPPLQNKQTQTETYTTSAAPCLCLFLPSEWPSILSRAIVLQHALC